MGCDRTVLAQQFLVIEKMRNFQASFEVLQATQQNTSLLANDPKIKEPHWHANYCETRNEVVKAIGVQSPALASFCHEVETFANSVKALAKEAGKMPRVHEALADRVATAVTKNAITSALQEAALGPSPATELKTYLDI